MKPSIITRLLRITCLAVLLSMTGLSGCSVAGIVAYGLAGDPTYSVKARYNGLQGKTAAVLVSVDDDTLRRYPHAAKSICVNVSRELSARAGAKVMDPQQLIKFQHDNPNWDHGTRYSQLLKRLKVDRIVHVDVSDYTTHEPGNAYLWQGVIVARVRIAAADAPDPDNLVFDEPVPASEFPENGGVGLPNSDDNTIELGMLNVFCRNVGMMFYDHEIVKPR